MRNESLILSEGHQTPIVPDLPVEDTCTFDWSDAELQNWHGSYGDEFVYMEGATTEDTWTSYMVPDPGPNFQPFAGPGSRS